MPSPFGPLVAAVQRLFSKSTKEEESAVLFETLLPGFHRATQGLGDEPVVVSLNEGESGAELHATQVKVYDARALQRAAGSARACFERHGFALLEVKSAVRDWDADPDDMESEVNTVYADEIEALLQKRLMPHVDISLVRSPSMYTRRGPNTAHEEYVTGVHQDFGFGPDDIEESYRDVSPEGARNWRRTYDADETLGYSVVCFWRTVHMDEALEHMPLVLCEPNTVSLSDLVPVQMVLPGRSIRVVGLRFNEQQRWYAFPKMRPGEVLAFRQFHCMKAEPERWATNFHCAAADPEVSPEGPARQSCEFRATIWIRERQRP